MAHLLCVNCYQKFDDEQSYTVLEITVPAFLTKSRHEEALSFHRPICPNCGARNELLSMEAMRLKTGLVARGGAATGRSISRV